MSSMSPPQDYISATEQNEIRMRMNENRVGPWQSGKKGSAED
jgi:hypothetical protein